MTVIIGVDPHKAATPRWRSVATNRGGQGHRAGDLPATVKLLAWAEPFEERTWAIESAGGLGYLLAQQLVDAGEHASTSRRPWPRGSGCSARPI